jgi:DNA-binding NarL/FixJ family response regulator
MTLKILLADDHKIMREGLRALIDRQAGMTVAAEATDGREAVQLAGKLRPDIVIMDVTMPKLNGIEAARQIGTIAPESRVIALSIHSDRRFVSQMFKAGARGYLLKDCAFEELIRAIQTVAEHQTYLSPAIAGVVVDEFVNGLEKQKQASHPVLTARESEVLQLIAEGRTTKQIAGALRLSVKTVETHRRQIMMKLQLNSVAELTKYAIREGLTPL